MLNSLRLSARQTLVGLMAILVLAMAACGAPATPVPNTQVPALVVTPTPPPKEKIIFSDLGWDSAQLQNRIAMYIVEKGYGYPVDAILGETVALFNGLINGDTQVTMEVWLPNQQEAWDKAIKNGAVIPVGKSLDDNWQSAFVVPTYVVEQNPDLKSVEDLHQFKDLFVTPESRGKARLVSCVVGWECEQVNADKVKAYGLDEVIELVPPGSATALFADLGGAYEKQDPWLGYMWGPTKLAAELDLTILDEPECPVGAGPETGCAFPTARVLIAVNPSLITQSPEVVEFLRKWDFAADSQVAAESWMADNYATVDEAAIWFLQNDKVWTQWVPSDVAGNVNAALQGG